MSFLFFALFISIDLIPKIFVELSLHCENGIKKSFLIATRNVFWYSVFTTDFSKRNQTFVQWKCWKLFWRRKTKFQKTCKNVVPYCALKNFENFELQVWLTKICNLDPSERILLNWNTNFRSTGILMPKLLPNTKCESNLLCFQAIQPPQNCTWPQVCVVKMYTGLQLDWLREALGLFSLYHPSRRSFKNPLDCAF